MSSDAQSGEFLQEEGLFDVIGSLLVFGTVPGLYGGGYDGVDCGGLSLCGGCFFLDVGNCLLPGELGADERAFDPVYDGFEGAGGGRGRFVGVGLQATSDGNEDFDHDRAQVVGKCSVRVPRIRSMRFLVIFVACLYFVCEELHDGWGERVGLDGGLDGGVVVDGIPFFRAVCDGFDGFRGVTMLGCCLDVLLLLFGGDVFETVEEGVNMV